MTTKKDSYQYIGMTSQQLDAAIAEERGITVEELKKDRAFLQEQERTAAQKSLEDAQKEKASRDAEVTALSHFMKLDDGQKQSFLSKALSADGNDVWKKGAGVGDGVAAKNRAKLHGKKAKKENPTVAQALVRKQIEQAMEEEFAECTPEFRESMMEIFEQAVEDKVEAIESHAIQYFLECQELMNQPEYRLLFDPNVDQDHVEEFLAYGQWLEEQIAAYEAENEELREENLERQQQLQEEVIFASVSTPSRRSTRNIREDFEADEDNAVLMHEEGSARRMSGDPKMRSYVQALERTSPRR